MAESDSHLILLEKVPEDRQADAALFLSGCFSLPPASTRGIAASGPIVLLSGMGMRQAAAILAELSPTLPAGVILRLARESETARLSRLQWPRPPRVYGREIKEFADDADCSDLACPICGGTIRVCREGGEFKALLPPGTERSQESTRRLSAASDSDPLFSGVKPLVAADSNYASLRSLSAGDTGFWLEHNSYGQPPPRSDPAAEEAAGGAEESGGGGTARPAAGLSAYMKPGAFALVLARTRDNQAVKMVADIMGIGVEEARARCQSLGLCVARDISLDEAQNLLARFKGLGARARIVKPR